MKLPKTPSELLNWIHNEANPPPTIVAKLAPILGGLSRVNTIILLAILACHDSGDAPAVTATVIERAGRSISHSQLDTLRKKGHLHRSSIQTKRTIAFAWNLTATSMPIIRQIDAALRRIIARTNAKIDVHLALNAITASYVGCDPARIHSHHTLARHLGIDIATDHDFITLLRDRFSIRIAPDELTPLVTMGDLLSVILRLTDLRGHKHPDGTLMLRVGKAKSGGLLDGTEHNAFPNRGDQ